MHSLSKGLYSLNIRKICYVFSLSFLQNFRYANYGFSNSKLISQFQQGILRINSVINAEHNQNGMLTNQYFVIHKKLLQQFSLPLPPLIDSICLLMGEFNYVERVDGDPPYPLRQGEWLYLPIYLVIQHQITFELELY